MQFLCLWSVGRTPSCSLSPKSDSASVMSLNLPLYISLAVFSSVLTGARMTTHKFRVFPALEKQPVSISCRSLLSGSNGSFEPVP